MNQTKTFSLTIRGLSKRARNALKRLAKEKYGDSLNSQCLKAIDFYLEQQLKAKTSKA